MLRTLTLVVALALCAPAHADLPPPPGEHSVHHQFVVTGQGRYPQFAFYIHPTYMGGGQREVKEGEPFSFYHMASPRLYAVPRGGPDAPSGTPDEAGFGAEGRAHSKITFDLETRADDSDPTTDRETAYRIVGVTPSQVALELVHDKRTGSFVGSGGAASLLALLVGVLALGGVLAWLGRRPSATATATAPAPDAPTGPDSPTAPAA